MRNASVAVVRFVAEITAVLVSVCTVCAGLLWLALWLLGIVFVWLPRLFLPTIMLGAVLAPAGCATMANGTVQRIPVTSDPPGARVLVDGRPAGVTPTRIAVSRRIREPVVEIEMDGFRPAVHRLKRREDLGAVLLDAALGVAVISVVGRLMRGDEGSLGFGQTMGVFALGAVPGIIDYGNGAAFRFRRSRIDTVLSALRQSQGSVVTFLDSRRVVEVLWQPTANPILRQRVSPRGLRTRRIRPSGTAGRTLRRGG